MVDQLTCTTPDPPDVLPFSAMDEALVVASGACMVSAKGAAAGVAGLLDPAVAYCCWMAAISPGPKPETM